MGTTSPVRNAPQQPVLKVTRYDVVSALLMAVTTGLCLTVVFFAVAWIATRLPRPHAAVPVELVEDPGGDLEGFVGETLQVDSPAEATDNPAPAEVASDETQVQETLENILTLADEAVNQAEQQLQTDPQNTGRPGSAKGTGRRALGKGPGMAGFPREQRWFVRYGDEQTLAEYGRQLEFFGVELGAIVGGKLVYLSKLSDARPQVRSVEGGKGETRLYMTWQGGSRRTADLQLFQRGGVNVGSGVVFQFYPPETENLLARLELDYQKRQATEIRRTYFAVRRAKAGYEFYVTKQTAYK